ncbi:uncharacterized protein C8R40DRAFT_360287 [Lentinula edodes]|uniref:uncharacterized protein n=1 Tax=Lentinula edodes TaxID=5353 RepID=UPI001E8D95E2|nr:uncharacterized protein C8R40DRAFT_360287 [Lentinula edodes]KAH7873819.1 hypothetical protein C8R40DRAFT_360287 [Lentinula edodes]
MSSPIDETFGAAYIGIVVAALLLGISVIQGFYYFTHQKDGWILRGLVAGVLVFDFVHQVLITHTGYTYLITFWQQPAKLRIVIWSLLAEVLFNGLTGFCVQCFLTYRIWKLSGTKVWLTVVVISLVFAEFACVIAFAVIAFLRVKTFEQLSAELKGLSVTVNALAVVGDLFIAGILTLLLQRSKTGFRKSDTMINKLTIFAVNTGALTSLCAVASLISIIAAPNTFIYISFFFSMGRLYTNSLLATLNARKMIRDAAEGINTTTGDNISLPCKGRASSSKLVFQRSRNLNTNISIQVDTTREFLSDLEHGVVRDRHLSDFKHDEVEIEEDLSEVNLSNGDIESNISSGIECTAV